RPSIPATGPTARSWRGEPPRVRMITIGMAGRPEDGPPPGHEVHIDQFRAWDPATDRPRLRVIVWRDGDGRLRYHGPPRWYDIDGLEEPRVVRAHDVTETLEEIVAELRRAGRAPPPVGVARWADISVGD